MKCTICGSKYSNGARYMSFTCGYKCKRKRQKKLSRNLELRQRPNKAAFGKDIFGAFKNILGMN